MESSKRVGKAKNPHDSSLSHVLGESIFIDDRPRLKGEIYVGILGSPISFGKIEKIDFGEALKIPGILGGFTKNDLKSNLWGAIVKEQPILAFDRVMYRGEPIALLASESQNILNQALKLIKVKARAERPCLLIEEGIEKKDFIYEARPLIQGDFLKSFQKSPNTIEDIIECGGQEHFYLENHASIAYPMEQGGMEIHSSSQHPTETQHVVANALGLSFHQVTCVVKRMGGAFGGKESQAAPFAAMAALVAQKLRRPARLILSKDQDMQITGKRHPFKNTYRVGFDDDGKILAFQAHLFANAGAYADLTSSILERAMFHLDGAYFLENVEVRGTAVRTNLPSNTAFRGFGGPQGNLTIEIAIEKIANYLNKDSYQVRKINCYQGAKQNRTPYGQIIEENPLPELFDSLYKKCEYKKRKIEVQEFNKNEKYKIRGLAFSATKFGIAFTARFLNQGSALVNLHLDGTIQVSTGATEMGQGVNTKIAQVVADAFGVDFMDVKVMTTSTEKNHNTSPTAASIGSDINCAAALNASLKIINRLKLVAAKYFSGEKYDDLKEYQLEDAEKEPGPILFENGEVKLFQDNKVIKRIPFYEICKMAYLNRVSLGGYGFFKTENIGFDKEKGKGKPFHYFTNGVAATEVEIDLLTGELKVLRTDILMDLGRSLHLGIDEGQVAGAFIQGMGWVTQEQLFTDSEGVLKTHSPTTYKIPNIQDIPRVFNIGFIENNKNETNIHKSKAVGEPPFLLGISCLTAIFDALKGHLKNKEIHLSSPMTNEKILMTLNQLN